jgi:pimeloyl-ACP methyl ester carboxylesterase
MNAATSTTRTGYWCTPSTRCPIRPTQNPTLSLDGDVEATLQVVEGQPGPVVLVGHSYGGAVITEAGGHDKVAALG